MQQPAISVIIPMFNAARYIGDCLDSLLAQTFTDFELIVVDDCSTDSGVEVVKNYAAQFGGRLKFSRTKKNLGAPGVPRNFGMSLSRGEYIFFMDADDAVTPTALEELYTVAKNFDADVVACEKYFEVPNKFWNNAAYLRNLEPVEYRREPFVNKPTLIPFDLAERVHDFYNRRFFWAVWTKLIRRDLIFENELTFAKSAVAEDVIFTGCLVFTAAKFILVPNIINYYRIVEGSITHTTDKEYNYFRKYVRALMPAFRYLDGFLSGIEFFNQHPAEKYLALETVWNEATNYLIPLYGQFPVHEFDKILREEFSDGDNLALAAFSFNAANSFYRLLEQTYKKNIELEGELRRLKE